MRTRVKICGITRVEDALAAAQAGADAVGLVFDPKSPRCVGLDQAAAIARALPPFVTVVGLFVNGAPERIREALSRVNLDLLQFHGTETHEQCRIYNRPFIKAVHMQPGTDLHASARVYAEAAGLVLDAYHPGAAGGTGESFDWALVPRGLAKPIILAGGLNPGNVRAAIQAVRPYAVDVASGVEAGKGIKDAQKISAFIEAVRAAA
ncbi:MAG: N-(5'-phosphoribosyl)anthranilate isomerase [Candidatus Muproteobacteria bacterium RIFCSPHIGHO2_02_FULL_65_16]|uniref:N-(5'-phosphoribosyl)anthranilate isomerase n=1 Tax=Candidatus Muproteobacteria bacterium RIFCSPHIGHO2_02_FULL_65_16 TaxID=1817766 RepID=A0A1F6U6H0_9PROT|nr:MAG: N-(5'-phosphoribosyl)anthranilate isomerase [Candidatus Muproteobacteria bacterium RIFCSPHIGHO2_02_FULL_65_16]